LLSTTGKIYAEKQLVEGGIVADTAKNANSGASEMQGPVGQGEYVVKPGDCMESIAYEHGFFWKTLWNLAENAELKNNRSPNVLLPGDRVTIPAVRSSQVDCRTDQSHKFVLLGGQTRCRLRFLDDRQQARSGLRYELTIDGVTTSSTLDAQGSLNVAIPSNASRGTIRLFTEPDPEIYDLSFGHLDPESSPTGIRARLNNLGFTCAGDGDWDEDLRGALIRFQMARNLPATGQIDEETRQLLKQDHES
jgi:hypothetical protein